MSLPDSDARDPGPEAPVSRSRVVGSALLLLTLAAVAATRLYGYTLFHTLAELYSIVIASTYFVIAWNTRRISQSPSLTALGIIYGFVAFLDLFHTLSFQGMQVFRGYDFPANQLWIQARALEAASLLAFSFVRLRTRWALPALLAAGTLYTGAGLASVFVFRSFPACFIAGVGQTPFKVAAEGLIIAALCAAGIVVARRRREYSPAIRRNLLWSIALTILSEASFTLYVSNFDVLNMAGHLLKIASFYLVYRSIVATGLEQPQEILYAELARHAEELRKALDSRNTLLSILSHDLRNPLSGIRGVTDLLLQDPRYDDPGERRELIQEIGKTASGSLDLLDRVLDWTRTQSGRLEPKPEPVSLTALAEEQADLAEESARAKDISLDRDTGRPVPLTTDREMAATIIRNFLSNAVKFTPRGGRIRISVERRGSEAVLAVRDSGAGMDEAVRTRLFNPGERVRGFGTEGERGTGFGLLISSEFVRKLGGRLEVESAPGAGSEFRLILPA